MKHIYTEREVNERLAANVTKMREGQGMSMSQLSRRTGLSFLTVHRLEQGWRSTRHIPNLRTITRISRVLGTAPHVLIQ